VDYICEYVCVCVPDADFRLVASRQDEIHVEAFERYPRDIRARKSASGKINVARGAKVASIEMQADRFGNRLPDRHYRVIRIARRKSRFADEKFSFSASIRPPVSALRHPLMRVSWIKRKVSAAARWKMYDAADEKLLAD